MLYGRGAVIIIGTRSPHLMRPHFPPTLLRRGFTLLELMIVITIVALLALMAFEGYGYFVRKGEDAACIQKMGNFGKGLQAYVTEHGQWFQEDAVASNNGKPPDDDKLWDAWFKALKNCGVSENDWYCPSDLALRKKEKTSDDADKKDDSGFIPAIKNPSYIPAKFGPGPYAPYESPGQPWAIESFGHPDGMNKVMPNGTVQKEMNFKAINRTPAGGSGGGGGSKK